MAAQATEYREVKAEEILKQIENGEDVNLTNCRIIGELNSSEIKLKKVANPYINSHRDKIISPIKLNEKSSVVESKITIKDSIFENDLYFTNVIFNGSVDFSKTTFNSFTDFSITYYNSPVDFSYANFNNSVLFNDADFNNSADFSNAYFNNSAYFYDINFNNSTNFYGTNFYGPAHFFGTNFYGPVHFYDTNFYSSAEFPYANFYSIASFRGTNFYSSADFYLTYFYLSAIFEETNFYDSVGFKAPDTPENIILDGKNSELFIKYYKNEARYADADTIYYNYRAYAQERKSLTSFSKWTDILSCITCGYGLKPLRTLYISALAVLFFSIIYDTGRPCISMTKSENNKKIVKFYLQGPGIYRLSNITGEQIMISGWDSLYFSIMTFTTVGSGEWYPKDNYRKWVTLEGLFGWIMLGIFMATLSNVIIRS